MKLYRQGDVLIREIENIPTKAKKQKRGEIILAYGEVTGHAHSIAVDEAVESFVDKNGNLFLNVETETSVKHQEHDAIVLLPGKYEVIHQREYTPEEIRRVAD